VLASHTHSRRKHTAARHYLLCSVGSLCNGRVRLGIEQVAGVGAGQLDLGHPAPGKGLAVDLQPGGREGACSLTALALHGLSTVQPRQPLRLNYTRQAACKLVG
jgi:hypothetical protein